MQSAAWSEISCSLSFVPVPGDLDHMFAGGKKHVSIASQWFRWSVPLSTRKCRMAPNVKKQKKQKKNQSAAPAVKVVQNNLLCVIFSPHHNDLKRQPLTCISKEHKRQWLCIAYSAALLMLFSHIQCRVCYCSRAPSQNYQIGSLRSERQGSTSCLLIATFSFSAPRTTNRLARRDSSLISWVSITLWWRNSEQHWSRATLPSPGPVMTEARRRRSRSESEMKK